MPDQDERAIFCCGPAPCMQSVRAIVQQAGFDMADDHEANVQAPVAQAGVAGSGALMSEAADPPAGIVFTLLGMKSACLTNDIIQPVARRIGLSIQGDGQLGLCGTGRVRRLAADTHWSTGGGIRDDEVRDGDVLACCPTPLGLVESKFEDPDERRYRRYVRQRRLSNRAITTDEMKYFVI